jgi:phage terminase large subunit GpA-like protein
MMLTAAMSRTAIDNLAGADVALSREAELRKRIFLPPPKLSVAQWADRYRMLTSIASAEPGRWRTDRAPYQRGIMDAFSDPMIERVVVMSSAQVGKTEIVLNVAGYFMDQDPAPILVLQPTIDMARAFSKDRLKEMIKSTPALRKKIRESGRRESEDTILHKQYPGGHITMVGANSAAGLASRPIRIVLNDEVDRFPASAGDEGDPVSLAKKRTATFWNRKEGLFSTPTLKGFSRIEDAFDEGDQRRFFVPCPHCGHKQHLRWSQIDFDTASYICGELDPKTQKSIAGCGALISETDKPAMLAKGEWIAAHPGRTTASFHLNALYSPWVTWRELIIEFRQAQGSREKLQVFVNTVLGETWNMQDGEVLDVDSLAARREPYAAEVPAGVGALTAFIDVQREWIELLVKGWGAEQESWAIAHHRLTGNPALPEVWQRVDVLLKKPYRHELGAEMYIAAVGIDSGDGEVTQHVYDFVRPRQKRAIAPCYATKGMSVRGKPILNRPSKKPNKYGVRVIPVGTDTAKDLMFQRLKLTRVDGLPAPHGYMHFPLAQAHGLDDEYLAQFARERVFPRHVKGVLVREYHTVPKGARNEAIDLEVGNIVMLHLLGPGVYEHLELWVARVAKDGARRRAAAGEASIEEQRGQSPADSGQSPAEPAPAAQLPPRPRPAGPRRPGGGWTNSWRR